MAKAAEDEADYTTYAGKAATDLQARFGDWLVEKCELTFTTKKEEAAFRDGVRIATALRMPFQRSPENQEVLEDRRAAKEEAVKPAKKVAPAKKATKAATPVAEEEEEAPLARPVKRVAKKVAAAEPARPQRRPARRRAAAEETAEEAPF